MLKICYNVYMDKRGIPDMPTLLERTGETMASKKFRRKEKRRNRKNRRQAHQASIPEPVQKVIDAMGAFPRHIDFVDRRPGPKVLGHYRNGRVWMDNRESEASQMSTYIHECFHAHQHQAILEMFRSKGVLCKVSFRDWQLSPEGLAFEEIGGWVNGQSTIPTIYGTLNPPSFEEAAKVYEVRAMMVAFQEMGIAPIWRNCRGGRERALKVLDVYRPWCAEFFPDLHDPIAA